jgi:hypothetical protein
MNRFNKKYNYSAPLAAISICGILLCTRPETAYFSNEHAELFNSNTIALCAPFKNMRVEYLDNTKLRPDSLYADSFLTEAANGLLMFEVAQRYRVSPERTSAEDSVENLEKRGYSALAHDTALRILTSKRVSALAEKYSVDLVVVPYSCVVKQRAEQEKGWRNSSGPGYDRPVSFSATTAVIIQLWDKSGRLLYERIGKGDTGRPILYTLFKKEKPGGDIVKFAKKMYAPPLIKSLYGSIKEAMRIQTRR